MAMYNKIITFLMLTFIVSISFAQQYTPMTAAGYQYKRAKVDSTLHIPSFCGVPNLRNSTAIQGALAMDTCANKLYQWTHAAGWSTISTNAIDSLKRSNDSIFARKSGVWVFQYKDSVGGGGTTPSLQDVATVGNTYMNDYGDELILNLNDGTVKHPFLWYEQYDLPNPPNAILDFSYQPGLNENVAKIKFGNYTSTFGTGYIEITDKESIFKNESSTRTIIQNSPSTYYNQTTYFPLMKGGTDTLATTFDIRNSAIDTANKWVNNIYRTSGVDSIYYIIGSTTYAIKDSAGGGGSQNGRFGNDTATVVMAKVHNNSGVQLTNGKVVAFSTSGTSSDAPSVKLANNKADSTSATTFGFVSGTIAINDTGWVILSGKIEKLNTSAFANGDIIYLDSISGGYTKTKPVAPYHQVYLGTVVKANAGNGSIYVKVQNGYELDEIHDVQIISKQNNQILVYSDTQQLWKNRSIYSVVDTTNKIATKTNIATKVNISDTASMLSPYARTNIVNANLATKVNISDTATMLTPYLRSNTASATYLAKSDSATYYTKYRSDTSRTNIYNALNGKQGTLTLTTTGTSGASTLIGNTLNIPQYSGGTSYTFSTGLTNSANTITNNLSTGVAGGQSVIGGTAASENLTLSSTSNATKGKILLGGNNVIDQVNNRIGINNANPSYILDVNGTASFNGGFFTGTVLTHGTQIIGGTNSFNTISYRTTNAASTITPIPILCVDKQSGTSGELTHYFDLTNGYVLGAWNSSSRSIARASIKITNLINTAGSESGDMTFFTQSGGTAISEKMRITGAGGLTINATNTAAGTTGNQTINKASGTVNIAAAGTTVTVTNSLVTTSSIVFAVIRTNDATATIKNVVPASGSFTINLNAATTAETSIGFFVIN